MNRKRSGIMFVLLVVACVALLGNEGCDSEAPETGKSTMAEMTLTEKNHQRLVAAVPAPVLETSLERKQLVTRLERFNDETKISYIYLLSDYGQVIAHYPIKGKVSSVNSKLTTQEQIIDDPVGYRETGSLVVESPALDGSYGTNGDAVFFFHATTDAYIEWNGKYMLVDQPMKLSSPPLLTMSLD